MRQETNLWMVGTNRSTRIIIILAFRSRLKAYLVLTDLIVIHIFSTDESVYRALVVQIKMLEELMDKYKVIHGLYIIEYKEKHRNTLTKYCLTYPKLGYYVDNQLIV